MEDFKQNMEDFKQNISALFDKEKESLDYLKKEIKNKDVTIVLGNTRSGKSTLVNYIIGTRLVAFSDRRGNRLHKESENAPGPRIEHTSLSCTTVSGVYRRHNSSTESVVDSPGFEDNRGEDQDLLNVYCMHQLKLAKTVKFCIVFDINDLIHDNIGNFIKSLKYAQALILNFNELMDSFCFIFTKDDDDYTQQEIVSLLQEKIIDVDGLDFNKVLVDHIATRESLIGIFRMPQRPGQILNEIDVNVTGAIQNTWQVPITACIIKPPISDAVQIKLSQVYEEYIDVGYFETEVSKLLEPQRDYINKDKYVYASLDSELSTTKKDVMKLKTNISSILNSKPTRLKQVQNTLQSLFLNSLQSLCNKFVNHFKFVVFLDESGLLKEDICRRIIANYISTLKSQVHKMNSLIDKIDVEQADRRRNNIKFETAVTAIGAGVPIFMALSRLGGIFTIGAGIALAVYACSENSNRAEERKAQGRTP